MAFWGPSRGPSQFFVAPPHAIAVALSGDAIWFQFLCALPPRIFEILLNFLNFCWFHAVFLLYLSDAPLLSLMHSDAPDMCKFHGGHEFGDPITFLSFILKSWNIDIQHLWCISYRSLNMMGSVTMDLMKLNFRVHTRKCDVYRVSGMYSLILMCTL